MHSDPAHQLEEALRPYHSRLLELFSLNEEDHEGYPLLKGAALDFIPRNVVKYNGVLTPIDLEWTTTEPVTADHVIFRCMRYDVIGTHSPYQKESVGNPTRFKLDMMKRFFPLYTSERDTLNLKKELSFQQTVKLQFDINSFYQAPRSRRSLIDHVHSLLRFFPKGRR